MGRTYVWAAAAALALHKGRQVGSIYLFCSRQGTPYTGDGFRSLWSRARLKYKAAGGDPFPENDLRAKVSTDSASLAEASARLGHQDQKTTLRHYRRKPTEVTVLTPVE